MADVIGVMKGVASCFGNGATDTVNTKAIGNVVNNAVQVSTNAGGTDALSKIGICAGMTLAAWKIGAEAYSLYISKDDSPHIEKFTRADCGGLSAMPPKIEGCFRKYVRDAIYRSAQKMPWELTTGFYDRFHQCFEPGQEFSCNFWGEDLFNH